MSAIDHSIAISSSRRARARANRWGWLVLPAGIFLLLAFGWPLLKLIEDSFGEPSAATNYGLFTGSSAIYRNALLTTFEISAMVTIVCLLIGYPYAYAMHTAGKRKAALLGFLVLLPFWSSVLVRTYAWTVWLNTNGIVNDALGHIGIGPLALLHNNTGTVIGMSHVMLPFMVLSLYSGMRRIDPELLPAAQSLGASPLTAFRKVFIPLSKPGIYAGCLIVFVISLGFYITPTILGSTEHGMISQQIVNLVERQLNFGAAAALGLVLLAATLVVVILGTRFVKLGDVVGFEDE
jgi:putative spermidine/putrescine transport system permease protein